MSDELACPRCGETELIERRHLGNSVGAGMAAGATAGSFIPVLGTLAGAFIGAGAGLISAQHGARKKYKCGRCEYKWGNLA
jgi:ribosomal protein S27AE